MEVEILYGTRREIRKIPSHFSVICFQHLLHAIFSVEPHRQKLFGPEGRKVVERVPSKVLLVAAGARDALSMSPPVPSYHQYHAAFTPSRKFYERGNAVVIVRALRRPASGSSVLSFALFDKFFVFLTENSTIQASRDTPRLGASLRSPPSPSPVRVLNLHTVLYHGLIRIVNDPHSSPTSQRFNLKHFTMVHHFHDWLIDQQYDATREIWVIHTFHLPSGKPWSLDLPGSASLLKEGPCVYVFSHTGHVWRLLLSTKLGDVFARGPFYDPRLEAMWYDGEWSLPLNAWAVRQQTLYFFDFIGGASANHERPWMLYTMPCDLKSGGVLESYSVPLLPKPEHVSLFLLKDHVACMGMHSTARNAPHCVRQCAFLDLTERLTWTAVTVDPHISEPLPLDLGTSRLVLDHHILVGAGEWIHVYSPYPATMTQYGFTLRPPSMPCPGVARNPSLPLRVRRFVETLYVLQRRRRKKGLAYLTEDLLRGVLQGLTIYHVR